jgi:hypothetical protein
MKNTPQPLKRGVRSIRKSLGLIFKTIDMRMTLSFNCQNTNAKGIAAEFLWRNKYNNMCF